MSFIRQHADQIVKKLGVLQPGVTLVYNFDYCDSW